MSEGSWAKPVDRLHVDDAKRTVGFNIEGRRVAGPQQGFGPLWDRTFTVRLGSAVQPAALIRDWRARFGEFWPKSATFHGPITSIQAGDVAPLTTSGITTGVLVIYADETSFSYITPEAHMLAGMITFSARAEDDDTVAEIRMLVRPADPLILASWAIAKSVEAKFWQDTLRNLAAAHGVADAEITEVSRCVDPKPIWKNWTNVFRSVLLVNAAHLLGTPFRRKAS